MNDIKALLAQGIEKFQKQDYQRVLQDLDRALEINPKNADIHGHRCVFRYKLGDREGAIADCQRAATLYLAQGDTKKHRYSLKMLEKLQI